MPRAVADGAGGLIIAVAEVRASPDRAFQAFVTDEVLQWWKFPGLYRQKEWHVDLRVCGAWSAVTELADGRLVRAVGEFSEVEFPRKVVYTRRFDGHPFLGERETTITYRFEPTAYGTLVTVRDEGFVGRAAAAKGNGEMWEKVLGALEAYLETESRRTA
jgi:uncharacterized protein YndB with AHSA1/START domain